MRAALYDRFGGPDVLRIGEASEPRGAVVEVVAAALNPKDVLMRKGKFSFFVRGAFPRSCGYDFAGTLAGRDVFGMVNGMLGRTCAERVAVEPDEHFDKPAALDFAEAASLPLAGQTALQALRDDGGLRRDQHAVVNGASGGVGTLAIQIAKALGARVTTISSQKNVELCTSLGADRALAYDEGDPIAELADVDVFFDVGSHLCLVPARGPSYVLRWPDGEPWRGVCGEDGHLDAPAPELRAATPPFDPTILAHVGLRRDPSGVTLLESSTGRRVCVGRSDTLTCADLPYTDSLLLSTDIDDMQLAQQAGTGWLALRQHVGDGGAEANVGAERLLVFELRGGELRFHGAIVLGRHTSERLEHDPPSRSIWRTDQIRHADVTLRGSGCLTVGPQTAVSRITDRFRRGWSRERTRRTQPRAGDRLAGDEPLDLYVDGPLDVSGHWVPRAEGGFARASICN